MAEKKRIKLLTVVLSLEGNLHVQTGDQKQLRNNSSTIPGDSDLQISVKQFKSTSDKINLLVKKKAPLMWVAKNGSSYGYL